MNAIIIDDDATARLIINQLCRNSDETIHVIEEFSNAIEAIKFLNNNKSVDVIFLDIHMPTFSGFDFIKTLKNPPNIILTTSDKNFALEAFEYNCIKDYLVKPIDKTRFIKSINKVNAFLTKANTEKELVNNTEETAYIYVNVNRRLVKIKITDIYLIEAKGDYINIKTESKNYIVHSTLKKIEEKLPNPLFLKTHRSYIINTSEIIDIEDNSVLIKSSVIPVSRSHKKLLIQQLNLL